METRITLKMQVNKRSYLLYIDCNVDHTDVTVKNGKYIIIYCHNVSIDEKNSDMDYKDVFEISPDGDYHMMVEFKKNPEKIRIFSQSSNDKTMQFFIEGE